MHAQNKRTNPLILPQKRTSVRLIRWAGSSHLVKKLKEQTGRCVILLSADMCVCVCVYISSSSSSRSSSGGGRRGSVVIPGNVIFLLLSVPNHHARDPHSHGKSPLLGAATSLLSPALSCSSLSSPPPSPTLPSRAPMLGLTLGISLINCYAYIRDSREA